MAEREHNSALTAPHGYERYADWKGWKGEFAINSKDARYFAAEFAGLPVAGREVLEIGFGNGNFLAWARQQGAKVTGLEINPDMLAAAEKLGYPARKAELPALAAEGQRYDLIVAFDVLEHWSYDELFENFRAIPTLLNPGGHLLARFPNGHSPFGRVYQYGDFTHHSVLSRYRIEYLAAATGLEIVRIADARRLSSKPGLLRTLRHHWLGWQRRKLERHIARLYGTPRLPLAPNLVAVLRRPVDDGPGWTHAHESSTIDGSPGIMAKDGA